MRGSSACARLANRPPHALRRERHLQVLDAQVRQRIDRRVHHRAQRRGGPALAAAVATAMATLRGAELEKTPGAAEAIDWARAMQALGAEDVTGEGSLRALGALAKSREDRVRMREALVGVVDDD